MAVVKLLTDQTTDTDGSQAVHVSTGGRGTIIVWGVFDGAEIRPEVVHDTAAEGWQCVRDMVGGFVVLKGPANDEFLQALPIGLQLRLAVTQAGTLTNLNAKFIG